MPDFADRIAEFALADHDATLPEDDRAAARRSIIDVVGVMLAGSVSEPGRALVAYTEACEAEGLATVVGTGLRRSVASAAFLNGSFAHCDDFDDMGGFGHPTAPMIGAAFPAIEALAARGISVAGSDLVTAEAVGFELGAAFCTTGGYDQYDRCFHSTPVFGALAATCLIGRLQRLAPDVLARALRHAAISVSGLGRNSGTMVKPVHAGIASRNAHLAIEAAVAGLDAPDGVFEARGGFVQVLFGHRALDLDGLADSLGNPWRFARTVSIKRFPCCGSNHSALNAVERILESSALAPDDIDEVVVHGMMESSPVLRFPAVTTGCSAKFSVQYVLAALIVNGRLHVEDFRDANVNDPVVSQLASRIHPAVVNRWGSQGASKQRGNPVSIRLRDGRVLEAAVPRGEILGGPKLPLPDELLRDKFVANAELAIGAERSLAAFAAWDSLDDSRDLAAIMKEVR